MFKRLVLASLLSLFAASHAYSDTFTTNSETLFNYLQTTFPSVFPARVTTQPLTDKSGYPILFRAYSSGWIVATYWWGRGIQRLYYSIDGGGHWTLFGTLEDGNTVLCGGRCWTPDMQSEVKSVVGSVLSLADPAATAGLTSQITTLLQALLSSGSSNCPVVVSTPPTISLDSPPPAVQINIDFGNNGCTASDGSLMKGSASFNFTNISVSSTAIKANLDLIFNNLSINGQLLANGEVTGVVNLSKSGSSFNADNVSFHLINFLLSNGVGLNGDITVRGTSTNAQIDSSTSELLYPVNGFALPGGNQIVNLVAAVQADKSSVINGTGTAYGFVLQFNNLVFNSTACQSYPVGGSINFTKNNKTATVTFDSSCNGSYIYQ